MAKTKQKKVGMKARQEKSYPVHVMVILVAVLIAGESWLALNTTSQDWHRGLAVLDVSSGVSSLTADVSFAFEPAVEVASGITEFYQESAMAAMQVLDISSDNTSPMMFVEGVNTFYQLAADEMTNILDLTNYSSPFQARVAGVSVSR